jgi:hypothetical protein
MDPDIFKRLWKESIIKNNIHYVPANFLRMNIYLELSRPMGFVERWKKVYSRLQLLNSEYPVICPTRDDNPAHTDLKEKLEDLLIREKVVLLGFNAGSILCETD